MLDLALDSRLFLYNKIDCAVQELDILLNTENTELIGYPTFGTEFETFLWTLTPTVNALEEYILDKINAHTIFCKSCDIKINIHYLQGEYRSIYYVQIFLSDNDGNTAEKIYRFQ